MTTKINDVVEKSVVDTLEQLLQRAVIDDEFRSKLMDNPEEFGLPADTKDLNLPTSVAKQDLSFVELVNNSEDIVACESSCFSGWTIICDGGTFGGGNPYCQSTCQSGITLYCDGTTF